MPLHYVYLLLAILAETIGTTALEASRQFTRPVPSVIAVIGFGIAIYFLGLSLRYIPVGIAYAIWSGLGIVLISLLALVLYGQRLDLAAVLGMGLIFAGIAIINLFSQTATHPGAGG